MWSCSLLIINSFFPSIFLDLVSLYVFHEPDCLKLRIAGDVGSVYFGPNHPMKPHRLCMTHHLVLSYDLHKKMEIYVSYICQLFHFYLYVWVSVAKLFIISVVNCVNNAIPVIYLFSYFVYDAAATQGLSCWACPVSFSWLCWVFAQDYTWHSAPVLNWISKM